MSPKPPPSTTTPSQTLCIPLPPKTDKVRQLHSSQSLNIPLNPIRDKAQQPHTAGDIPNSQTLHIPIRPIRHKAQQPQMTTSSAHSSQTTGMPLTQRQPQQLLNTGPALQRHVSQQVSNRTAVKQTIASQTVPTPIHQRRGQ